MTPKLHTISSSFLLAFAFCGTTLAQESQRNGLSWSFDYVAEGLSNVDGGLERGTIFAGLVTITAEYQNGDFTALANVFGPHGDGLTEEEVGDFAVISNIDTVNDPRLQEVWVQQAFSGSDSLRLGMLAADTEFWGSEYGGLFVNSVFGAPTFVSANLPGSPIFPVAALGLRYAHGFDAGTLRVAVLDGNAGDPADDNPHGLDITLDDALFLFELQGERPSDHGPVNSIRLSGFWHTGDFVRADGNTKSGNWGLLAVFDLALSEQIGLFGRLGFANAARSLAPFSAEAGINIFDLGGGTLGFALARVDINGDLTTLESGTRLEDETIFELTYEWPFLEHFALQPDLQYILKPGGDPAVDDALVIGLRGKVSFEL